MNRRWLIGIVAAVVLAAFAAGVTVNDHHWWPWQWKIWITKATPKKVVKKKKSVLHRRARNAEPSDLVEERRLPVRAPTTEPKAVGPRKPQAKNFTPGQWQPPMQSTAPPEQHYRSKFQRTGRTSFSEPETSVAGSSPADGVKRYYYKWPQPSLTGQWQQVGNQLDRVNPHSANIEKADLPVQEKLHMARSKDGTAFIRPVIGPMSEAPEGYTEVKPISRERKEQ